MLKTSMPSTLLLIYILVLSFSKNSYSQTDQSAYTDCSEQQMKTLIQSNENLLSLSCIPIFKASSEHLKIRPRLLFESAKFSNMSLDCQGATLTRGLIIRSVLIDELGRWSIPENIKIQNCRTEGMIHVYGVARNGEGEHLTESSRRKGHTERTQSNAPTNIHFNQIDSISTGVIPFYFGPGVTNSSISHSNIAGNSASVAIYFDAETANNRISNNRITTKTKSRELIALDGSANNTIINNYFTNLFNGGIYLYRNCGEGGNIRHQTPQNNLVENNTFEYKSFWTWRPAVWLSSRNGNRNYCDLDEGYDLGSSKSDRDYAQHNQIINNLFIGRVSIKASDQPNIIEGNKSL